MRVMKVCILVICMLFGSIVFANAESKPVIKVGFVDFQPFFYLDDGEAIGSIVTKLRKIAHRAGYDVHCQVYPMKRLADFTKVGTLDMTVLLKVVFDEQDVVVSDEMLCEIELRNYTILGKDVIAKKEDLSGKRIGIFRGFTYGGWIDYIKDPANNVDYHEVASHEQLFRMLELGRVNYVLDYRNPSEVALKNVKIENLKYDKITSLPVYMLISRQSKVASANQIVDDFNKAYAHFLGTGEMRVID